MSELQDTRLDDDVVEVEELVVEPPKPSSLKHDTPLDIEVVRVSRRDDFDHEIVEDADDDDEGDAGEGADGDGEGRISGRERFRLVRQLVLGTILSTDVVRENYRYVAFIAFMLFFSIVMLFSSLSSYLRYTKLEDEVHLLRERAIRMSEQSYEQSSHSAIVRRLKERGIDLIDPQEPHERLE